MRTTATAKQTVHARQFDLEADIILANWQRAHAQKEEAEATLSQLRTKVLELHAEGIEINNGTLRLAVETATTLSPRPTECLAALGQRVFNRIATVPIAALRGCVDAGILSPNSLEELTTASETTRVVLRKVKP